MSLRSRSINRYKYIGVKCKTPGCPFNARCRGYCMTCYTNLHHKAKRVNKSVGELVV